MTEHPRGAGTRRKSQGGPPQLVLRIEVASTAARAARNQFRELLQDAALTERVTNAALDVAHELMVNAHQHAKPPVRLVARIGPAEVRVEVSDGSTTPARVLPYRPGVSERGLGLHLVRHLSTSWGQEIGTDGKTVWALID